MKKFKLTFKTDIIVKANSIEEAYAKVDDGQIVRSGFQTTKNGTQHNFFILPEYELKETSTKC